jgi:hypothetical protein
VGYREKPMTRQARIPRDIPELIEALRRHVEVLRDCYAKAFQEGDEKYLGEVAGKLRVPVVSSRSNSLSFSTSWTRAEPTSRFT